MTLILYEKIYINKTEEFGMKFHLSVGVKILSSRDRLPEFEAWFYHFLVL